MRSSLMRKISYSTIKVFLLTVILMCMTSFAFAASGELSVNQLEDDSVVISGNSGASLKRNTTTLYITDSNSDIVYTDSVQTNTDGSFEFVWIPKAADDYSIKVKSGAVEYFADIWYSSVAVYNNLMNMLSTGTDSDIETVLSSESSLKTLGVDTNIIDGYSAKDVSAALYHIREYKNAGDTVLDYMDEAKVFSEFMGNPDSASLEKLYNTAKDLGIELSQYEFFKKITNTEIVAYTLDIFSKGLYENFDDLSSFFEECIIISGVYKCTMWTEAVDYLSLLQYTAYDSSQYKDAAAQAVAGNLYVDSSAIEAALLQAINAAHNAAVTQPSGSSSGGSGSGGGGGGSQRPASLNTIASSSAPIVPDTEEEVTEKIVFNDVPESHWAFEAINHLRWNSIVLGDDYNCFYPDEMITRAEMCAMLTRAYDISDGKCEFTDVPKDSWYYKPIAAAFTAGLVEGDGESFRPMDKITRQDMAVLVYRFATHKGKAFTESEMSFADKGEISDYAVGAVSAMTASGIINGMDTNRFAPWETAARAQAAKLIYEVTK